MSQLGVLNPGLYHALRGCFGPVRVVNPGRRQQVYAGEGGRLVFGRGGETYYVCCRFCHDRRFRLAVSHRWDEFPDSARSAYCFNDNCFSDLARRQQLQLWLLRHGSPRAAPGVEQLEECPDDLRPATVAEPGRITPLDRLPPDHPVVAYIRRVRGFDPVRLARDYGVGCCERVFEREHRRLEGRVYLPCVQHGELVGWQGRFPGERDWHVSSQPKYYSCPGMATSLVLYNHDLARRYADVVVTEGALSAWAVGPCAVALFGHNLSHGHRRLLRDGWGDGCVVFLLDPDAWDDAQEYEALMAEQVHATFAVRLPEGEDPATLGRRRCWELIHAEARARGVQLAV